MSPPRAFAAPRSRPRAARADGGTGRDPRPRLRGAGSLPPTAAAQRRQSSACRPFLPRRLECAAAFRPQRVDLGHDPLAELVAGSSKGERRMRMQALELLGARRAADPEVERRSALAPDSSLCQAVTNGALVAGRCVKARGEVGIALDLAAPSLDASRSLE